MEMVRWFASLAREDVPTAGGKGANLGELARAGLPVPPGFVLTTAGYDAFVAANALQPEIVRLAEEADPNDPAATEAASEAIRALFDQGRLPPEVREALLPAYSELGRGLVAVRSSATAEDLPGASFAGQQETYLHLEGEDQVTEAVLRCWSSLWTPRAMAYRSRQGIKPGAVSLAVVVQRLIPAEAAGILFTANPVNGRRDQMVVDAAWGLGEAVVSGQVSPDHWVIQAETGEPVEFHPADKAVWTVPRPGGTETLPLPESLRARPSLSEAQVAELAALGRAVAAHYGFPQDVEWALEGGRFYLVQSRPITSLFPLPHPLSPPESGLRVFLSANNLQGVVEPLTPMGQSALGAFAHGVAELFGYHLPPGVIPPAVAVAAHRGYVDVTAALRHPTTRRLVLGATGWMDRPLHDILQALLERDPHLTAPGGRFPIHYSPRFVAGALARLIHALAAPDARRRRALAAIDRWLQGVEQRSSALSGPEARARFVQGAMAEAFGTLGRNLASTVFPALGLRVLAERLLRRWSGESASLEAVLRSLPHNPTTEMDLALWRLSRRLKAEGAEPAADHPGVREFLSRYGHRAVREIDLGMPRWSDDPTQVLAVLRTYLSHSEAEDPERQFEAGARAAEEAAAALVRDVRRHQGPLRAALMRFLLSRIRRLVGLREYPKFYAIRTLAVARRVVAEAGRELVARGRLDAADDVFFITLENLLKPASDLRGLARRNREEYTRELGRRAIPRVILSTGETFYGAPASADGGLTGAPASSGVYEGRVRVVLDPKGAKLEPGEILVAPGTDPAWTPLFFTAGALVMEIGGIMSHGSVVAREYGIPAVVGVVGATQVLRTGQRIRVDGESGRVYILDEA